MTTPQCDGAAKLLDRESWQWVDDTGRSVRLSDLRGREVVLSMFYRGCAVSCPLTLAHMRRLEQALEERHREARFVLVTLNPRYDTPARLASYRREHSLAPGKWVLIAGGLEQTTALARTLGVARVDDFSHFIHSAKLLIISADGKRMRTFENCDLDEAARFAREN